jgi:DNA-3-methyladenine glycosylase II
MDNIVAHIQKDKKLFAILSKAAPVEIGLRKNAFMWLVRSVTGQQLSTKVAAVIFERLVALCKKINPENILAVDVEALRSIGFSYQKANYIQNIAAFWQEQKLTDAKLQKLSDEEVIALLTQIKGVGEWTVQMLLMFTLGRENIFPILDLGIQQAMQRLYGWEDLSKKELFEKMKAKQKIYSPHCTIICKQLWIWKDAKKNAI